MAPTTGMDSFCLKKEDHLGEMMQDLRKMLSDDGLLDVTLSCQAGHIKAHRVILAAASSYFRSLFTTYINPHQYPVVIIQDMPFEDLEAIIHFIYNGEVNVPQSQLPSLLRSAQALKIKSLLDFAVGDVWQDDGKSEVAAPSSGSQGRRRKRQKPRRCLGMSHSPADLDQEEEAKKKEWSTVAAVKSAEDTDSDATIIGESTEKEQLEPSEKQMRGSSLACKESQHGVTRVKRKTLVFLMSQENCSSDQSTDDVFPDLKALLSHRGDTSRELWSQAYDNQPKQSLISAFPRNQPASSLINYVPLLSNQASCSSASGLPSCGVSDSELSQVMSHTVSLTRDASVKSTTGRCLTPFKDRNQHFFCDICHQGFTAKRNLQRHMQIHSFRRNKFRCDLCFKTFCWKHTLKIHMSEAHNIK